jgi:serine/threonine-protein kinase
MGTVFRARDEALERDVAVKVMAGGLADPEARARFEREARAAARLQHPNIVVVYELGVHDDAPFMVLELLEGTDLSRAIESGVRPDPRATLPLVLQLLAGLGHAHEHGIVHRDVKPSNLFLPRGRPAKVMDFGVARLAGLGTTTAGTIVGTPNYMSPEQVTGGELDGRSDLFSAGLILYELVTGERAVQADTVVSAMYKIAHETPDLGKIPGEPGWGRLREVVSRALDKGRDRRYGTAAEMADALSRALEDLGGCPDPSAPSDQALLVRPRAGRTGPWPIAEPARASAAALAVERRAMPRPPSLRPAPPRETQRSGHWLVPALAAAALAGLGLGGWWLGGAVAPGAPGPAPAPAPTPAATPATPAETAAPAASTPPAEPGAFATAAAPAATPVEPPEHAPGGARTKKEARIAHARELLDRGRFAEALAEARLALDEAPADVEARALAQEAETEVVLEDCLRNAREALRVGDRERALEELRRGFFVRKSDPRLLELHREAVRQ